MPRLSSHSSASRSFDWYLVTAAMAAIGVMLLLTITGVGIGAWFGWTQWQTFTQAAGLSWPEIKSTLEQGSQQTVTQTNGHKNILILGVDTLAGRGNAAPLTDTMIMASLNLNTGSVTTVSLPRDIWSDTYQTKINSLYTYGLAQNPAEPTALATTALSELTGVPIHHTVVLTLDQVAQVIDLLGGIEVDVQTGFVDEQFPRPDVDVTVERDPAKLYQRVEFQPGLQVLSGERALQFIRSRHSLGDEGDDVARARRQQQVIAALINRLQHPASWLTAQKAGQLVALYQQSWASALSLPELVATAKALKPVMEQIELRPASLSIYPADPEGLIWHPPVSELQQNQWVYSIVDPVEFKLSFPQLLGIPTNQNP